MKWFLSYLCLLPVIGNVFAPFALNECFSGETYVKDVWSRFRISFFGMSYSWIIDEVFLWNVSFSSSKNCSLVSILPVVPFPLTRLHWSQYTPCTTFGHYNVISSSLQFWWTICFDTLVLQHQLKGPSF